MWDAKAVNRVARNIVFQWKKTKRDSGIRQWIRQSALGVKNA